MDTALLEVPTDVATEALADYKALDPAERTDEDRAIIKAYEAITRGQKVISLSDTIRAAGMFDGPAHGSRASGLPRLAIARAHTREVWVSHSGRTLRYSESNAWAWPRSRKSVTDANVFVRNARPADAPYFPNRGTLVPSVPAKYRPKAHRAHLFHILWEVDEWDLVPPGDPALLRHLAGDMWAVLAQWDLTAVERAAMERGAIR